MALDAGNADCTTGMSKRIYDNLTGDVRNGFSSPMSEAQANSVKALCHAVARAVVYEMTANAVVNVTADTDDFGVGIPAAPVVIQGGVT